jgi:hypothetical protein
MTIQRLITIFLIEFSFINASFRAHAEQDDSSAVVETIRNRYITNNSVVKAGKIDFEFIDGEARNDDDARKGVFTSKAVGIGCYRFDGERFYYQIIYDEDSLRSYSTFERDENTGRRRIISKLHPFCAMTSNGKTIHVSKSVKQKKGMIEMPYINSGSNRFWNESQPPWPFHAPEEANLNHDMSRVLSLCLSGKDGCSVVSVSSFESTKKSSEYVISLIMRLGQAKYFVDPKRGSSPTKILSVIDMHDDHNMRRVSNTYYDDYQFDKPGVWVPHRVTLNLYGNRYNQYIINRVDLAAQLTDKDFEVVLNEHRRVYDEKESRFLPAMKVLGPSILGRNAALPGSIQVKLADRGPEPPVMPGEIDSFSTRYYWWIVAGAVLVISLTVAILLRIFRAKLK